MNDRFPAPHIHHHHRQSHTQQPLTSDDTGDDSDGAQERSQYEVHFFNSPNASQRLGFTPTQAMQAQMQAQIQAEMQSQLTQEEMRERLEGLRQHMASSEEINENEERSPLENEYKIVLVLKFVGLLAFQWLGKLTPTTRLINKLLFLHFILSLTNVSYYIQLCPISITQSYQIWRVVTYPFAGECLIMFCLCKTNNNVNSCNSNY